MIDILDDFFKQMKKYSLFSSIEIAETEDIISELQDDIEQLSKVTLKSKNMDLNKEENMIKILNRIRLGLVDLEQDFLNLEGILKIVINRGDDKNDS